MGNAYDSNSAPRAQRAGIFIGYTMAAAFTAAMAAYASVMLVLPVWAMFVGWVAYFTRGHSLREGVANLACLAAGIGLGIAAALGIGALPPAVGTAAVPLVVFLVAALVVSLRAVPLFDNLLAYFLGLIAFFAIHREPTLGTWLHLAAAGGIGGLAAWISTLLQAQLMPRRSNESAAIRRR